MQDRTPRPEDLDPIERASVDELRALQLQRLRWSLRHAYDNVPHYRKMFDERQVHPDDLRELADLARFPFTDKAVLRANYPFGMFAVPRERIARLHASSGTTGRPTVVGYTGEDLRTWARLMARSIRAAGGPARRSGPRRLRVRAVHRRSRRALRRRGAGLHGHPGLRRHDRTPGHADQGLRAGDHHGDAQLHAGDRGRDAPAGHRPARHLAAGRHLRRRALDPGPAAPRSSSSSTCTRSTSTACPR